jgi:hypothetical protein
MDEIKCKLRVKRMEQGDFYRVISPKHEGLSGGQFCIVNETLDNSPRKMPFFSRSVQKQIATGAV